MRTRHLFRCLAGALLVLAGLSADAQTAPATYWVRFADKAHTPYSLDAPEAYLSPRALGRRARQHIPIDSLDLPVDPAYITALLSTGEFELLNRSRWSNAITVRSTDTVALNALGLLPFVSEVRLLRREPQRACAVEKDVLLKSGSATGPFRQLSMMNGDLLQDIGEARGEGLLIGILDAGFEGADTIQGLSDLRSRDGIRFTRDLVQAGGDVYGASTHGRSVLSVMAGRVSGKLQGSAPGADYVLLRTEDSASEYPVEEDNWVSGAELCDSLGCDVLNTSLGYALFTDPAMDHTYADLDGLTLRNSIAAGIATRKGMIPVNSAGNSGASAWRYITAAADAIDILTVGAVLADRSVAAFSSRGPSADGRVKPDVSAMGQGTIGLDLGGADVTPINGTSFAAPLVAGLTACLWQLHRDRSAHDIMDAVRRSASHWAVPNDSIGYGIPDFWRAHLLLGGTDLTGLSSTQVLGVMPVPFAATVDVALYAGSANTVDVRLHDLTGRLVYVTSQAVEPWTYARVHLGDAELRALRAGPYMMEVRSGDARLTRTVIKAE